MERERGHLTPPRPGCAEARAVYLADAEEDGVARSRFSVRDITSGLLDDSREEDERAAERRLRDLRGRVKRARAVVASAPGLAEVLQHDWQKTARFYGRFGVTEAQLRHGVPLPPVGVDKGFLSKRGGESQESERRGVGGRSRLFTCATCCRSRPTD